MKIIDFLETYQPAYKEYCPCIIDESGEIYECRKSHMDTLIELSGDAKILEKIPADVSPLFYLMSQQHCVIVDFENQICDGALNMAQEKCLLLLELKGWIERNLIDIKGKMSI